jgi:hypothetical protein
VHIARRAELEDLSLGYPDVSSNVQAGVIWFPPTDFLVMDEQLAASGLGRFGHNDADSPESLSTWAATIGLYKTELIKPRRPRRSLGDVELATAEWGGLVQRETAPTRPSGASRRPSTNRCTPLNISPVRWLEPQPEVSTGTRGGSVPRYRIGAARWPFSGNGHAPQYANRRPVVKVAWSIASVGCRFSSRTGAPAR